jgi:hypothetical protein
VRQLRGLVILVALVCAMRIARADCPAIEGSDAAALTANGDDARLAWIQARLARTSHRAQVWRYAWGAGIIGATAIDLAMIPILGDTHDHRIDFGLGAATTLPGIVPLAFLKPRVIEDHATLDAKVAAVGADRCAVLGEAEKLLIANAAAQRAQRAWYVHAGNIALNTGVVLLFGAFHHWTSGVINGVGGALVGELIIYTEPIDQVDDLEHYRRGDLGGHHEHAWHVMPNGTGLTVSVAF